MKISLYEELKKILPQEKIFCEEPMSRHTTFRIGGPADYYIQPDVRQLSEVLRLADRKSVV